MIIKETISAAIGVNLRLSNYNHAKILHRSLVANCNNFFIKTILFLGILCLASFSFLPDIHAAGYSWTGGGDGSAWEDANNWNPSTGPPGSGDSATIDLAGANVTVAGATTVSKLTIGGTNTSSLTLGGNSLNVTYVDATYNGDLTIGTNGTLDASSGTPTITVGGNWDSSAGTFSMGSSTVVMTGTGNTLKTVDTLVVLFYNLTINAGASTTLSSGFAVRGLLTISGTLIVPAGKELGCTTLLNNLTINAGGELAGAGTFKRMIFDGAGHIINNGTISVGTFIYAMTWNAVSAPITAATYGGNLIIQEYEANQISTGALGGGDGTLVVNGNLTVQNSSSPGNSQTLSSGSVPVYINGNVVIASDGIIDAGSSNWTVTGDWDSSLGTFTMGTSTVILGANGQTTTFTASNNASFNNFQVTAGAIVNITPAGTESGITVHGDLTINGTLNIPGTNSYIFTQKWNVGNNSTTIGAGGVLEGNGTFVRALYGTEIMSYNNLTGITISNFIYKLYYTWDNGGVTIPAVTYGGNLTFQNWANPIGAELAIVGSGPGGSLTVGGNLTIVHDGSDGRSVTLRNSDNDATINVTGDLTIGNSSYSAGANFITGNAVVTVGGNWTNNDTFSAGSSTVTFNGTGAQSITGGGDPFNAVAITNTSAGGVTFADALTANTLTDTTNGSTLKFATTGTHSISNTLTITGGTGSNLITLEPVTASSNWNLSPPTGSTVSGVDVSYSQSDKTITADNSNNGGNNNANWVFGEVTRYWVAGGAGNWNNTANWSDTSGGSGGFTVPGSGDTAVFDANGTGDCTMTGAVTVSAITNTGGYTGTFDTGNNAVTVNGDFRWDGGTFTAGSSTITVGGDWDTSTGTFNYGTSTVVLDGSDQSITGSTTFYNLTKTVTSTANLTFDNTATQSITNTLTLNGAGGQLLLLRSDSAGNQWEIDPQGTGNVSYVDVQDSNNINAAWISTANSVSSGNNTRWYFNAQTRDIDNDGTNEEARDSDGNSTNGYEVFYDPDCPSPGAGKICAEAVLSIDGDGNSLVDHFIDTDGDNSVPESYWDPDSDIQSDINLADVNGSGNTEWVYDSDGDSDLDHAYNSIDSKFIDPFGIVFDSITNEEIAGAVVTIYNKATNLPAVPGVELNPGDSNPLTTNATGTYGFNVTAGDYYIKVTADGYTYPSIKTDFPAGRTVCPTGLSLPEPCNGQSGSKGETFTVTAAVITMDHPMDVNVNLIKVTKKANKKEANIGDIITYTITIESKTTTDLTNVYITDRIPAGFNYIKDRAILDNQNIADPEGRRPITFNIGTLKAGQTRTLKYQLIIGSGVTFSKYENSAWARYSDGIVISNVAKEEVRIVPDSLFDLGTVIGKVFLDRNGNGVQDGAGCRVQGAGCNSEEQSTANREPGIPKVRIVTEDGTIITTDKDGKYHLAGITPGRHILRIDERTLPEGAYPTTDKAVIIDITPGILQKVNFAVNQRRSTDHGPQTTDRPDSSQLTVHGSQQKDETQSTDNGREPPENDFFFVALADVKAGYTDVNGNIEPAGNDHKFKQGFWSEGKLAYYLKGKIKGKYIITSSLDTDREKKELFKNLDPDKYYPVYGDASTVNYDAADTQGMLYLAIEWDKSKVMWGNYHTEITDTELAQFNRTLYGAKLHYETVSTAEAGKPATKLIIFQAEAKQKAAHNEFLGTGGSLYYLRHRPVVEGSDKVAIEIRDKNTNLVIAKIEQTEGDDYEIDYSNSRIIFYQPVSQTAGSNSIISTALLNGNPIYVVVDYEYKVNETDYNEWSYGGRAEQSLMDLINNIRNRGLKAKGKEKTASSIRVPESKGFIKDIRLGGTYVKETRNIGDYELKGIDTSFYIGENAIISGEYAESTAQSMDNFLSTDGGLSFTEIPTGDTANGKAYSLKAETGLYDRITLKGYYKRTEKGFSDSSTISEQGMESIGVDIGMDISQKTRLKLSHDTRKLIDEGNALSAQQTGAQQTDTTTARITHDMDRLKLTGEYRLINVKENTASSDEEGETAAVRADYGINKNLSVFLGQQATLRGKANDQTSAGVSAKLFNRLNIKATETIGTNGNATSISAAARVDDGTELYNTYSLSNSHMDGKKTSIVTGSRKKITDGMDITAETQNSSSDAATSRTNILGLSGQLNERWGLSGSFQRGVVQSLSGSTAKRSAGSIGVSYVKQERIKASGKIELRIDDGQENMRQYLSYNAVQWKGDENTTLFVKLNLSESKNTTLDTTEARYKELAFGGAYRPVNIDRLNLFAKYTYLEDKKAPGQSDMSDIEEQRTHVLAAEAVYDLTDKWQIVEKLALKQADEKVTGFDFTKTQTRLWINRVNYNLYSKWQLGAEYRILKQRQAKDIKQGALIEVARVIGKNIQIGAGYNFTDFNDNLTYLDYTSQGPFIRVTAKITD